MWLGTSVHCVWWGLSGRARERGLAHKAASSCMHCLGQAARKALRTPADSKGPAAPTPFLIPTHQSKENLSSEQRWSPAGHSKLIFWYIIHLAF